MPGIRRRRTGRGWCYRAPDGTVIRDRAALARIRALAIPPAYRDVWICPNPNGHIQASGRDARGRKQYRYYPGDDDAARKRAMLRAIEQVSAALGNTPTICRKCYIHPAVLDAHMTGTLAAEFAALVARFTARPEEGLTAEEAAVMALLDKKN